MRVYYEICLQEIGFMDKGEKAVKFGKKFSAFPLKSFERQTATRMRRGSTFFLINITVFLTDFRVV